jgi:hypothetical protein
MPSAQQAATAVMEMKPIVQRRLGAGGGCYLPTRITDRTHDHVSTPFRSKSSRVVKVTITGDGGIFCSASDSHILYHVMS